MTKYYVGHRKGSKNFIYGTVFTSKETPTAESHGKKFTMVVGAFRTKRGAMFMAECGYNNPHCQTVADAERLAKTHIRVKKGDWRRK